MSEQYDFVEGKNRCPKCAEKGEDKNGDNFFFYGEGLGGFCFKCGFTIPSEEFLSGVVVKKEVNMIKQKDIDSLKAKALTPEKLKEIEDKTVPRIGVRYRGMDNRVCQELGVRWEVDENGKPTAMYFPTTVNEDGEDVVVGYKVRKHPKDFYSVGYVGKVNGFLGQNKAVAETLIIVAGEIDLITAIGSLENSDKYRKSYNVVTSPLGEDSTAQIIKQNYDWVDSHKKIIVCMDNDKAGEQAFEKIKQVVDNSKLFKSNLRHKDLNDYLKNGDDDKLPSDLYWNAVPVKKHGIAGSGEIFDAILETVNTETIKLPPFLSDLQPVFKGGFPLGEIINFIAPTSVGKTVIVNELIFDWVMKSPHKVLLFSLEDSLGNFGAKIASRVSGVNILALEKKEDKIKILEENKDEINKYLYTEDGDDRFNIVDKVPTSMEDLKEVIVQAIKLYGSKLIIIDPLTSLFADKTNEEQADFMNFEENLKRDYNVTICNTLHTRKSGNGQADRSEGADYGENDIKGSGAISSTATINILLSRNKMEEDPILRNTTSISVSKNRTYSVTGRNVAKIYYSPEHHTLFSHSYAEKNNFFRGVSAEDLRKKLDVNNATEVVTDTKEDVESELDNSMEVF